MCESLLIPDCGLWIFFFSNTVLGEFLEVVKDSKASFIIASKESLGKAFDIQKELKEQVHRVFLLDPYDDTAGKLKDFIGKGKHDCHEISNAWLDNTREVERRGNKQDIAAQTAEETIHMPILEVIYQNFLQESVAENSCGLSNETNVGKTQERGSPHSLLPTLSLDKSIFSISFSSGTTGKPKAMCKTHRSVLNCKVMFMNEGVFNFGSLDRPYVTSCHSHFAHVGGMTLLLTSLMTGGVGIIQSRIKVKTYLETIAKHGIQATFHVPSFITEMVRFYQDERNRDFLSKLDLSSLEDVLVAGEFMSEEISRKFVKYFRIKKFRQSFGSTENGFCTVVPESDATVGNATSSGIPLPGVSVKIMPMKDDGAYMLANQDDGEALNANEVGEILIKTNQMSNGYMNNEKANLESYDRQGFLRTGDGGFLDDRGFLYVCDRFKEIIKVNGSQVSPTELECILLSHPSVKEAAVIGIPDESRGHVPRAFVVLAPFTQNNSALNLLGKKQPLESALNHACDNASHSCMSRPNDDTAVSKIFPNLIKTPGKQDSRQLCLKNHQEDYQDKDLRHENNVGRNQKVDKETLHHLIQERGLSSSLETVSQMTSTNESQDVGDTSSLKQQDSQTAHHQSQRDEDSSRDKEKALSREEGFGTNSLSSEKKDHEEGNAIDRNAGDKRMMRYNLRDLEDDLLNFVSRQVSDHKRIRGGVFFLESFPRTVLGKTDRKFLRNHYRNS